MVDALCVDCGFALDSHGSVAFRDEVGCDGRREPDVTEHCPDLDALSKELVRWGFERYSRFSWWRGDLHCVAGFDHSVHLWHPQPATSAERAKGCEKLTWEEMAEWARRNPA